MEFSLSGAGEVNYSSTSFQYLNCSGTVVSTSFASNTQSYYAGCNSVASTYYQTVVFIAGYSQAPTLVPSPAPVLPSSSASSSSSSSQKTTCFASSEVVTKDSGESIAIGDVKVFKPTLHVFSFTGLRSGTEF